jgi:AcrR family transcriptional regulator
MESREIWLGAGYEAFAKEGLQGLKVEPLSRIAGISKSSFYHHFADMEVFLEELAKKHLVRVKEMHAKEMQVKKIDPDLISILVEHKFDLLFNRQLRIRIDHPFFKQIVEESDRLVGNEFIKIWANDLQLPLSHHQLEGLFSLALENFYLQMNAENLNQEWLSAYFVKLKSIAQRFQ